MFTPENHVEEAKERMIEMMNRKGIEVLGGVCGLDVVSGLPNGKHLHRWTVSTP